jgi:hypothetical protein
VRGRLDFRDQFIAQFVGFAVKEHVPLLLLLLLLHVMVSCTSKKLTIE